MRLKLVPKRIRYFRRDVVIDYHGTTPFKFKPTKRAEVKEFSKKARNRLAFVAANTDVDFRTLITLTYPGRYESDGKTVKRHLRAFLMRLRRSDRANSYLWFLEFQKRGAPHFHILITTPFHPAMIGFVADAWYEIVDGKDPKHLSAGTRVEAVRNQDGARRYALKYAGKMRQKRVPADYRNCGRFFGYSRDVKPQEVHVEHQVSGRKELLYLMSDWPHVGKLGRKWFKVAYNASVVTLVRQTLDNKPQEA